MRNNFRNRLKLNLTLTIKLSYNKKVSDFMCKNDRVLIIPTVNVHASASVLECGGVSRWVNRTAMTAAAVAETYKRSRRRLRPINPKDDVNERVKYSARDLYKINTKSKIRKLGGRHFAFSFTFNILYAFTYILDKVLVSNSS